MMNHNKEAVFSCTNCEYNIGRNRIGCGGHCLKQIMYQSGGATYLKKDIVSKPKNSNTKNPNKQNPNASFKLVICEKPSVAMQISRLLKATKRKEGYMEGNGWRVSWCLGHLVRVAQPNEFDPKLKKWTLDTLPILPKQWMYFPETGKEKQLNTLKRLMNADSVTTIVNACDAGREGELIFRLIYDYVGCTKPFSRLWIHSMEDKAIVDGFQHLRSREDMENLYQAALCRSQADYIIGINATRKYGVLSHRVGMTIGRVQSPLLTMLVERAKEIEAFEPTPYYQVHLNVGGLEAVSERLFDLSEADALLARCDGQSVTVQSIERKQKTAHLPKLYDLTMLQRDANRLFGYSAKETLNLAQTLYEKKLISYPRTDSQYIPNDMQRSVSRLVGVTGSVLGVTVDFLPNVAPITDNAKVSDHYALLPTETLTAEKLEELDEPSRNVLTLICHRLFCATALEYLYEETVVTLECGGTPFTVKGKRIVQEGWKGYELNRRATAEQNLPELAEGQTLDGATVKRTDHKTTAPEPYTEDTLLSAMEHAGKGHFAEGVERSGLGTPATRAAIIEKMISSGYAVRKGKKLIPTGLGRLLADALPEQLRSADLTAKWENDLLLISEGKLSPAVFMEGIYNLTRELMTIGAESEKIQALRYFDNQPIGVCPRCGNPVYEEGQRGFFCADSDNGCSWGLWANSSYLNHAGIVLDRTLAQQLIDTGKAHVTGVKFKGCNEGELLLVDDGIRYPSYRYVDATQQG